MTESVFPLPEFANLYRNVPEEKIRQFRAFRECYPYQAMTVQGLEWRFIDTRSGAMPLFLPASGTGVAEVGWETIQHLAEKYRVISLDYPPVGSLRALFSGVIEIFDRLGIDHFNAMGGSGGALFLQPFLQTHSQRINKMILATPVPPSLTRGKQMEKMLRWFRVLPTFVMRYLLMQTFDKLAKSDSDNDPSQTALVMAMAREIVQHRLKREHFLSLFSFVVDMTRDFTYTAENLRGWHGKLLLLFGTEDPSTPEQVREEMLALYPQAQVRLFDSGGHTIALTHQKEYFEAIDQFLTD
jgi:pimeloyl-ACP methyl ester carboxylesterase